MSSFAHEDRQGSIDFVSDRDITLEADRDQDGAGAIVFKTGGVERARIKADGTGTGWPNVLGGSISASGDPALPIAGATVQLADRSAPLFPTVEEMFSSRTIEATMAAGTTYVKPIFVAPFPLVIKDIWLTNFGGAITLDGSNNWSFRFRRYRVTAAGLDGTTGNRDDILDNSGTNFNPQASWLQGQTVHAYPATYSPTLAIFRPGDIFALRIASTGTPTSLSELCCTVRWEPI